MADGNLILAERTFTSVYISTVGIYGMDIPAEYQLVAGNVYTVVFDGTEYSCSGQDADALLSGATAIGNCVSYGLSGNNEPFALVSYQNVSEYTIFCLQDTAPTEHTLAIYGDAAEGGGEPEEPQGIGFILKDYKGEETTHYGLETLEPPNTSGESIKFIREDLVPTVTDTTVALDFSGGDMEVAPNEGEAFGKVIIPVPEGLAPENIAEGVNIAGIVGALAGGGSGKVACGLFTPPTSYPNTINHDLGIVPDIVFVVCCSGAGKNYAFMVYGVSQAFSEKNGGIESGHVVYVSSSYGDVNKNYYATFIDATTGAGIHSANKTTFTLTYAMNTARKYLWVAVGGLT